ncbi:hypothetical protein OH77DRAFT_546581 [Trametes cingulata]|nr:hypothetical protein OH77DRAFT_546581 [Trametes cingulata]
MRIFGRDGSISCTHGAALTAPWASSLGGCIGLIEICPPSAVVSNRLTGPSEVQASAWSRYTDISTLSRVTDKSRRQRRTAAATLLPLTAAEMVGSEGSERGGVARTYLPTSLCHFGQPASSALRFIESSEDPDGLIVMANAAPSPYFASVAWEALGVHGGLSLRLLLPLSAERSRLPASAAPASKLSSGQKSASLAH